MGRPEPHIRGRYLSEKYVKLENYITNLGGSGMAKTKPVEIIGVDIDTVERDTAFPEAYAFYIKLSSAPDPIWKKYLAEWQNALYSMKKEIRVEGDKLCLVFVYGDNIEGYVRYVTQLIKKINGRVEEHNKRVEISEKREMTQEEAGRDKEDEIRKKLREL